MPGKGPAPAPTALKILRGNPGRRPLNKREPKPPAMGPLPAAPAYLEPAARAEWARVVPDLAECGLLTRVDLALVASYCATWGRVLDAEAELAKGLMVKRRAKNGKEYPALNPYFATLTTLLGQLKGFVTELGMSPAARSRIQVEKPEPEDDLAKFKRKHDD
jgi:P27 family predicted phage terminase small subunit